MEHRKVRWIVLALFLIGQIMVSAVTFAMDHPLFYVLLVGFLVFLSLAVILMIKTWPE